MKRFVLLLAAVTAVTVFSTSSASAVDSYYGRGGHRGYTRSSYGSGFGSHGYAVPSYGHGYVQSSYYAGSAYGGHGYRQSYGGHGGGFQISTPRFGFRLGH